MRLRLFEASTVQQAMASMRRAMGEDAVILATEERPDGVSITAALDPAGDDLDTLLDGGTSLPVIERIAVALRFHGFATQQIERLCLAARHSGSNDPEATLGHALGAHWRFEPIGQPRPSVLLIAGGPGSGKTTVVARLAAASRLAGRRVRVLTTDVERRDGAGRLRSLLQPMGLSLTPLDRVACDLPALEPSAADTVTLIDTESVNPTRLDELAAQGALARRLGAEFLPVLPAVTAPAEARDLAAACATLGARRALITAVDTVRRIGLIGGIADAGLALAGATIGPHIATRIKPLTGPNLARLLLRRACDVDAESAG